MEIDRKKKFLMNVSSKVVLEVVTIAFGIIMPPFLVRRLGQSVYGVIPLIYSCYAYVAILSTVINTAVGRYVTMHHTKGEYEEANEYITTALVLLSIIGLIALAALIVFSVNFSRLFNIPSGEELTSSFAMFLIGLESLIQVMLNPLIVGLYSSQNLWKRSLVWAALLVIKNSAIILCFVFLGANLLYVAAASFITGVILTIICIAMSLAEMPHLKIGFCMFNRKKIKAIFSFGGWSVLAHIASIIFFSTDVIIANKIFGSVLVTIYYFGARWHQFIKSLVWNIFMNIVPAITSLEAEQKIVRIRQIMMYGTSRILMVTLPLCLIPSIFADELMYIWQGPGYGKSALILKIFLVPASVTMNIILMDLCLQGLGKVRFLGVNSILFAIVNIGLSLALALWTPLRLYGIAVSTSLCLFLRNVFVTPTYSFRFFSIRPQDYYLSMLRPVVLFLPVLASGYALNYFLKITSLLGIVIAAFGMTASYAILLWLFILSVDEKKSIRSTLRKVGIR